MKSYVTRIRVGAEHIDAGDHANWIEQLRIAERAHFAFRDKIGIGLELLKERHGLFLVMGTLHGAVYRRQLRLGDTLDITLALGQPDRVCLGFECAIRVDGCLATRMSWTMPLVRISTARPCRIPEWMLKAIK